MYLIIDNENIISCGQEEYKIISENTKQIKINNSMWEGKRKFEIKWNDIEKKIINKTEIEIQEYYDNIKEKRIIELKEKIYIRQQINEDKTEFETELQELIK